LREAVLCTHQQAFDPLIGRQLLTTINYTAIPGSLGICWAADSKDSDGFRWHQLIRPD
jgi:hypothetical protein